MLPNQTVHTIHLHGTLGEKYGPEHRFAVSSPAEAARALAMNYPGFAEDMANGGYYRLVRGEVETGREFDEDTLTFPLGDRPCDFHIVPVAAGAKNGGVGKAILGVVIMVAAVIASPYTGGQSLTAAMAAESAIFGITYGTFFAFGAAMLFAGISQMLQKSPNLGQMESTDQRNSYLLGGQVNQTAQGGPVPWAFGRIRVGSTVISAGLETSQV